MNPDLALIPHYLSKKIADLAASDPEIVNLSIGEPFFGPPRQLEQRFADYLRHQAEAGHLPNKYASSRGDTSLRRAISGRYQRLYGFGPDPEKQVLVTHGAAEAIWLAVLCLTQAGDEVLIPDPSYMLYETVVRLLNRVPVRVPTTPENGFVLDPEAVKPFLSPRTRLMFINSPENPTGAVYSRETFLALGALAEASAFYLVHDEVYDSFLFDKPHYNLLREGHWPPYLVLINSFSKRYAMMGWRLGWLAAAEAVVDAAIKVHTNLTLNLGSFHQEIAGTLLNDPEAETGLAGHTRQIQAQLEQLWLVLGAHKGFRLPPQGPQGGFFLFPNIATLHAILPESWKTGHATPGESVAAYLLAEHKLAVVPGYVYGPAGNDHVRIVGAVTAEDLARACARIPAIPQPA